MTAAYVGAQGRNLFLRSIANPIVSVVTNPNPANAAFVIRQFSIVQRDATGAVTGVQNPYAEIDTKTSGGHDNYNALQLGLTRRSARGLSVNAQYTLSRSFGNTSGSNEALTVGNAAQTLADYDYDTGYNAFDVRHTFTLGALYQTSHTVVDARSRQPESPTTFWADGTSAESSTREVGCRSTSASRGRISSTSMAPAPCSTIRRSGAPQ